MSEDTKDMLYYMLGMMGGMAVIGTTTAVVLKWAGVI